MTENGARFVRAAGQDEVEAAGCTAVQVAGHVVALFAHGGEIHAVDNRCPHMGFPLEQGTVKDGILTCHWHHARFDLESGGRSINLPMTCASFRWKFVMARSGWTWPGMTTRAATSGRGCKSAWSEISPW